MKFHTAIVIYNPNSTGNSEANARSFVESLKQTKQHIKTKIVATKFAGHAEEISAEHSDDEGILLVSSSGDGGYNEVINGVLTNGGKASTAVLPSGNANDHHAAVGSNDLADSIVKSGAAKIEVLRISSVVDGKKWQRYAHSYIGFGLTPKVGRVLTEVRPNFLTEKWYVLRHTLEFRYVSLLVEDKKRRYNNLIFATVPRMSKVIKLDADTSMHDGKMELYETVYVSPLSLLKLLFTARFGGIARSDQVKQFSFKTIRPTLVQLDGEVFTLDTQADVTIECVKDGLRTVL